MKSLTFFTVALLIELTCTAPTKSDSKSVTNEDLPEKLVIYSGDYDIANILFPVNSLQTKNENNDQSKGSSPKPLIFFALADYANGLKEDKGFYVRKNGEVTKLLDHGRDAATAMDDTSEVYIAAKDGLYIYNSHNNRAEKYGTVTDDLIGIAKVKGSDIVYILTQDHIIYKVTEKGTKKDKIMEIDNPEQMVLDNENNLYYVSNNKVNVFGANGTKVIEGLPETAAYVKLIRPPILLETGIPVVLDNSVYFAFGNGTSVYTKFNSTVRPSAYSLDGSLIIYLGHDKKIYEYNILVMILDNIFTKFRQYLDGVVSNIGKKLPF